MVDLVDYNPGVHGTTTVIGNKKFKVPATDFMISPLTANADLHLNSMVTGVTNDVVIDTLIAGKYTKVDGAIPHLEYYVDTAETFYVKW